VATVKRIDILKALATGPAFALAGFLSAIITEGVSSKAELFSPSFIDEYSGLWIVPGCIGFILGLLRLIALWHAGSND
jgi:hypothetical protein